MNIKTILKPFLALIFCTVLCGQEKIYNDIIQQIRDEGFNRSKVDEYIWNISDVNGPRLPASPNMRQAQSWAKNIMEDFGLKNARIEAIERKFASWDLEYVSIHMMTPDYQMVIGYPFAITPGTNGKITANVMAVSILKPEDLEKYKGKLKGKIVLASPKREFEFRTMNDAVRHTAESLSAYAKQGKDINYDRRKATAWYKRDPRPEGITMEEIETFYKTEGVKAVFYAGQGEDGTVRTTRRPSNGRDRSIAGIKNALPTLSISAEHYNRMYRLSENGHNVNVELEVRVKVGDELNGQNIMGEIPGSDLADELVMIGAHFDSWHTGTGATDNGSGSAVILEAMRILRAIGVKPRRTIRMALWDAEEGGAIGSRDYVANTFGNPKDGTQDAYDKLSVYFNTDNGTGQIRGVHLQGNDAAAPIFEAWMKPFADLRMKTLSAAVAGGTDHVIFDRAGLPGFQFIQDRIQYRLRTWHYNMDTYDHVIIDDLKINAVVMAAFAYHAAMRDEKFPRKPFKTE